ncbi:MAG: alpha-E domain-containing protein [Candidatus Omnitrophica bacterium]|nr:alpha-E domain-containing protein [Candidatus Omnitrophota bacterium]MCB9720317.1 alpha-E domain-containing protein [Candidatus Omnitrophota bacterium]
MLSRVANSIYWINRYIERAENYARFIDVNNRLTMDLPPGLEEQWRPLVETTGDQQRFEKEFGEDYSKTNVINFLVFDDQNPNSVFSCLSQARENARTVREMISSEMWLQINELYLNIKQGIASGSRERKNLADVLAAIKMGAHTFDGIMDATYSHGEGWHFGILGRYMERSDKTARILDMKYYYLLPKIQDVNTPLDMLQWSALLRSASAYEMYRKQYGKLDFKKIIQFLALDRIFPRSMHYCLIAAERSLHAITGTTIFSFSTEAEKELGRLRSEMDYTDVGDIMRLGLHEYLDVFQIKHNRVSEVIFETFFAVQD